MGFCKGDRVEVCSKAEGFLGSYYEATVMARLGVNFYSVKYKNLVEEDLCTPLVERVSADEVRPLPPRIKRNTNGFFSHGYKVDAFDNDGWWVGKITGKKGCHKYYVYFETTGDEIAYPVSALRTHLHWCNGNWIYSSN